jgi:hypothetical protein
MVQLKKQADLKKKLFSDKIEPDLRWFYYDIIVKFLSWSVSQHHDPLVKSICLNYTKIVCEKDFCEESPQTSRYSSLKKQLNLLTK